MGIVVGSFHIMIAIIAVTGSEIIEAGKTVGTASNQYLLGMLIVGLIAVVVYRERQQNRQHNESLDAARAAADKVEKAAQDAARKADEAILDAQQRNDKIINTFAEERKDLYARMERQNNEMNEERRARWTMMIDVIRENTIAFRETRGALETLKTFLAEKLRKE